MPEYIRPRPERLEEASRSLNDSALAAQCDFDVGLGMMSTNFDAMVADFTCAIDQKTEAQDLPERVRKLIEFAMAYHKDGLTAAIAAVENTDGFPVDIAIPDVHTNNGEILVSLTSESRKLSGVVFGLVGAHYMPDGHKVFDGIATIDRRRGRDSIVAVGIMPDGAAFFHPEYLTAITPRSIEELFPPQHFGTERKPRKNI